MFTNCRNLDHDECVYNLIEQPAMISPCHSPMYRSRFACRARFDNSCYKTGYNRTMGPPKVCLAAPTEFLKKQSRVPISIIPPAIPKVRIVDEERIVKKCVEVPVVIVKPEKGQGDCDSKEATCGTEKAEIAAIAKIEIPTKEVVSTLKPAECPPVCPCPDTCPPQIPRLCCTQKPPIPPWCRSFGIIPRGPKDFIRDNAVKVSRQPAKIPHAKFVDDPKGHTQDWCNSGYPRKYVCKSDFGQVPDYLVQRKQEHMMHEQEMACKQKQHDLQAQEACRHMSEEERTNLICGLKNAWYETYQEFQSLSLYTDTIGKVKRKACVEAQLNSLEKDIQLVERHNHLFLADTDRSFYLA